MKRWYFMIKNKFELKKCLNEEKAKYISRNAVENLKLFLLKDHDYLIWKYIKSLRMTEYSFNCGHRFRYFYWQRKKNTLGAHLGITIWHNTIESGCRIWHYGSIIVNGHAKIGINCQMHGENCIGNKGEFDERAPEIGDNVDIGVGAKIIGPVYIADNVKVGANAVVINSCYKKGATLVGVPAREV